MSNFPPTYSLPASCSQQRHLRNADAQLCRLIERLVATTLGVTTRELRSASRGQAPVAFARQAAMYVGHVVFGLSLTRLGRGFGRDRTTARHACRVIEDRRDDPAVDQLFGMLEAVCGEAASEWLAGPRARS
jgi:chromosomal replication initiation ATPase DnaA